MAHIGAEGRALVRAALNVGLGNIPLYGCCSLMLIVTFSVSELSGMSRKMPLY